MRSYNGADTAIPGTFAQYAMELGVLNDPLDDAIGRIEHLSCLAIEHCRTSGVSLRMKPDCRRLSTTRLTHSSCYDRVARFWMSTTVPVSNLVAPVKN